MADMKQEMGSNIKKFRKKKGYKQDEFAEMIGISNNHMSTIESGRSFPSVDTLIRIMNLLDCSADDIFSGIVKRSEYARVSQLSEKMETLSEADRKKAMVILEAFLNYQD